jgi:quinol monooxygenase YgiN
MQRHATEGGPVIIVVGTFNVAPEDRDQFLMEKQAQVIASSAEPGCHTYAFSADPTDPGLVRLIERWEDGAAFAGHLAALRSAAPPAPHAVEVFQRQIDVYDATAMEPLT